MKKILVIITTAFVPWGGLATVMMNLYRHIDKTLFKIDFASTNYAVDKDLEEELYKYGSKYFYLGDRKKNPAAYACRLASIIKREKYDIVHINSNSASVAMELALSRLCGVQKRIVHNHTSICNHRIIDAVCNPVFQKLYTDAVACSKKAGDWIFKDGAYRILNNGIDTDRYRYSVEARNRIRDRLSIEESTVVIGHLGKIYKPKNHHFLVDIFDEYHKSVRNSILLLVGDGVMKNEIEEMVNERCLRNSVIFAGMQREAEEYLSAMDIFVFPSLWEGMPLSLIEAQASGLPCLASANIDRDVMVTDSIQMLPIDTGVKIWKDALVRAMPYERDVNSTTNIQSIINANFGSKTNAKILESIYLGE